MSLWLRRLHSVRAQRRTCDNVRRPTSSCIAREGVQACQWAQCLCKIISCEEKCCKQQLAIKEHYTLDFGHTGGDLHSRFEPIRVSEP